MKRIELEKLKEIIEYLENNPKVKCEPYPYYDKEIFDLLYSLGVELRYQDKYEKINEKEISNMTLKEIRTIYTFILRGERFSVGHIKAYIEDGTLLRLARREYELLK